MSNSLVKLLLHLNKAKYLICISCLLITFLCQAEPSVTVSEAAVDLSSFKNVQQLELPKVSLL